MSGLRFSIANLLTAVAIIAIGLSLLSSSSGVKAGVLVIVTLGALLGAVLGVIYREGEARAFWLGAAIFGGAYFVVVFTPAFPYANEHLGDGLRAFRAAFWTVRIPDGDKRPQNGDTAYEQSTKTTLLWPSWHHGFGATAHCVVLWLFALTGGIVGRWFYVTRRIGP